MPVRPVPAAADVPDEPLAEPPAAPRRAPRAWRYVVPAAVAVAAEVVAAAAGDLQGTGVQRTVQVACAVVLALALVALVRAASAGLSAAAGRRGGEAAAVPVQNAVLVVGAVLSVLLVLDALQVPLRALLLGGALTGVVLGVALQQVLGNVFAGLVLLLTRPYGTGDLLRLRGGTTGGLLEGRVVGATLTHLVLRTPEGVVRVPNAGVLGAVIGPSAPDGPLPPVDDPVARGTARGGDEGSADGEPPDAQEQRLHR
ncbi:mechanosensitive ion channel family protein [uncultured Pseudokineococcus sp.]|uniref:mechanosensitive ion channel family protein n=1 Tax=uncultured Pseudokineococcus sp. TaxID=1642928 RepID=UPI00260FB75C|nr:mechanosensitive ion channel family protein [uncultured Pseudokineococcus sp.]